MRRNNRSRGSPFVGRLLGPAVEGLHAIVQRQVDHPRRLPDATARKIAREQGLGHLCYAFVIPRAMPLSAEQQRERRARLAGRPFGDGVLFNDTGSDHVRWVRRDGSEVRFEVPQYDPGELTHTKLGDDQVARQGFGRGLCVVDDRLLAAGSSPSTVTLFDLQSGATVARVNFSMDVRNAIHGLEVWPY